jgi:hypothetical protein
MAPSRILKRRRTTPPSDPKQAFSLPSMNSKSLSLFALACFGLLVVPFAVVTHRHLYADGGFFFARLVEFGVVSSAGHNPFRFFHHVVTQSPAVLALHAGVTDLPVLSYIFGAMLYYGPLLGYALAGSLLFRAGQRLHLVLLVLLYSLLFCFTGFFIISESHLATALFVLTLAVICTCDLTRLRTLLAIVGLAVMSLSCYEFWSVFSPVCLGFLVRRTWGKPAPASRRILYGLIAVLYLAGSVANTVGIISAQDAVNRNQMVESFLIWTWPTVLAVCVVFVTAVLYARFLAGGFSRIDKGRSVSAADAGGSSPRSSDKAPLVAIGFAFVICSGLIYVANVPRPEHAYPLRNLNLLLPLMFAGSFLLVKTPAPLRAGLDRTLRWSVLAVLLLTLQAHVYHTARWADFTGSLLQATQDHTGFVPVQDVNLDQPDFLSPWTAPTLSIVTQAMHHRPVQTVLYNPHIQREPYGPRSDLKGERLARRLGVPFEIGSHQRADDRTEDHR